MLNLSKLVSVLLLFNLLTTPSLAGPNKAKPSRVTPSEGGTKPPQGFVEMTVEGLVESGGGKAVVLKEGKEGYLLPIWIGEAEAFSIQLRLDRRRFTRPLTHDLLDTIMRELGGKLIKIQVDDLKDNTFVGTVFIQHQARVISIDARPSDSIALALGNQAPIFVSLKVLERAGIRKEKDQEGKPSEPGTLDQEKLLKDILESDREEHTL